MWVFNHVHARIWSLSTDILTRHRGIFICIFLMPISVALNIWHYITKVLLEKISTTASEHEQRVVAISNQVKSTALSGKKLTTDRPGYETMSLKGEDHKRNTEKINMRSLLLGIVGMDSTTRTLKVEPLVNMGQISRFLIPQGWTLAVLPELDELTVGGLLMGFGIESTSHIFGLFQEICVEYEVVLGNGDVVKARADNEYSDLFYALPWSYGTIGLLVSATLKIIPCQPYVRLSYRRYNTAAGLCKAFADVSNAKDVENAPFIESLAFTAQSGVIMVGKFTDSPKPKKGDHHSTRFNDIGMWYKEWFYHHVQKITGSLPGDGSDEVVEIVPLRAYYHRHTRSIFWEMQYIIPFADHTWFRYLFGWAIPPNIPLMKATQTKGMKKMWLEQFCVQDMLVPMRALEETIAFMDNELGIYPVWLCPHLVKKHPHLGFLQVTHNCKGTEEMYVDVGVYGVPTRQPYHHKQAMPRIEAFVRQKEGYQGLYAVCYMNKSEFRTMFHHELYDQCRMKYGAVERFPDVFDKTCGVPAC